jgi:lipopolysaccharide transport system permease protein
MRRLASHASIGFLDRTWLLRLFRILLDRHALLRQLVRRELQDAYAGSLLNRWWALLHPLAIIGLYLFVFGFVFQQRVGADAEGPGDYAVFMLPGLCAWLTVSAALTRSATALLASANLVKQVVFPIELLPIRSVIAAQMPVLLGVLIVAAYSALGFGKVSPLLPLLVLVVMLQAVMLAGFALFLSALTVFVRDVRDVVQVFTTAGLFITPVLYAPGLVPEWFDGLMVLNPFAYAVWCLQDIFHHQQVTRPGAWLALPVAAGAALFLGQAFFQRTRAHFGDAL